MATTRFEDTAAGGQAPSAGAVAYACSQLGFRVFPLMAGTKRPALKDWKRLATREVGQIREWWAGGEFTGYPVGIATGPGSELWVLDLDRKNGVDGFASLRDLAAKHGSALEDFIGTITVATPSGGAHLYFRWDDTADAEGGVKNSSGHVGPGIDVRGIGGLVKAPGCGGYQIVPRGGVRSTVITPAPAWLVKLTRKPPVGHTGQDYVPGGRRAQHESKRVLEYLGNAAPGTRNNALNATAYVLGKAGALTHSQAWQAVKLVTYSIGANDSEAEQLRTFESGWASGVSDRNV
jgi:hypothetical protein